MLDLAVDLDVVKKAGAWYTYEGEQLGQGRENVKRFLRESPELMVEISEKVRAESGLTGTPEDADELEQVDAGADVEGEL